MTDPDRKSRKSDARVSGMVATVVLALLAVFTLVFLWVAA